MYKIDNSLIINGLGIIATEYIPKNTIIGIWLSKNRISNNRVLYQEGMTSMWYEYPELGRYCNHSILPNTYYIINDVDVIIVSNEIQKGSEIFVNYNWCTDITGYQVNTLNFI